MSFSQSNKLRARKKDVKNYISELPNQLQKQSQLITEVFTVIDDIGKNLAFLADQIDPDQLEIFDTNLKDYNLKKNEINKVLEDVSRISDTLKSSDNLFNQESGSAINDTVIDDLQNVLVNINETIGTDINQKLEQLKSFRSDLQAINEEVKQPVEHINETLDVFKKTVDVSFEIFTKTMLESMKNVIEMNAELNYFLDKIHSIEELIRNQTNNFETIIRSQISDVLSNMEHRLSKSFDEKIKDMALGLKVELAKEFEQIVDSRFKIILDNLATNKEFFESSAKADEPLSRDMQEMQIFLKYLYNWPQSKDEIIKRIEEFRDILLVQRGSDAPFRVTATNNFREAMSLLTREDRVITQDKLREVISVFENLKEIIKKSEQ